MKRIKILVCEDERLFALELKERLEKMGHTVIGPASSGAEAIEIARKEKPDLALMDISLDGPILGTAVADSLAKEMHIPSIFVTAFADAETVSDAHRSHPLAYLVKPIGDRELEMAIEFGMAQHRLRESLRRDLERYRTIAARISAMKETGATPSATHVMSHAMMMMEELGGVTGHIAHHLNNSLAGVIGYLEWLNGCETLQDFERRYVQAALEQCNEQKDFVQRLQWASQEGPRELAMIRSGELVSGALAMVEQIIRPDLHVQVSSTDDNLLIFADQEAVKNALSGIIVNASDASFAGGEIVISATRDQIDSPKNKNPHAAPGPYLVLSVRDGGAGMTAEQVEEVCAPFVTSHENPRVAGLGLSVAYGVAHAHGGWMDIDSAPGNGTVVKLYFPVANPQ